MIKQALIGLTAAALLAGCGGEDKAQALAAKATDGTKTVGLVQLVEHPALDAASRGIQDAVKARGLKVGAAWPGAAGDSGAQAAGRRGP